MPDFMKILGVAEEGARFIPVRTGKGKPKYRRVTHLQIPMCPYDGMLIGNIKQHEQWHDDIEESLQQLHDFRKSFTQGDSTDGFEDDSSASDDPGYPADPR